MPRSPERPDLARAVLQRTTQVLALHTIWMTLFFLSAGTVHYAPAWVYLGLGLALLVVNYLLVLPRNPEVIIARSRGGAGTKAFDRWFGLFFGLSSLGVPVVAGLDAVRFGWSSPPPSLIILGLALVALGDAPVVAAMIVNPHLEKTVRIQRERGHEVIETGPYALVRHPMYVGVALQHLAQPLALGSLWAFAPALAAVACLVVRTALEDRTLRAELPGYEAYTHRTRARLVPGVW
ncbi:MAG: isoprenylcysteine carboxylmethyltransferase family protein [Myxococcales bacterium]|nr:isoprenylcysteine carboxylmethyltransferase family protein [Myxococcales bacterium]